LQSAQDWRIKPVQLSAAGRALIETAMVETVAATRAWLRATLRPEALGQLTALLAKLAKLAESGADEEKSA
jgi:DNA-binding MarR family transcriptional regulator